MKPVELHDVDVAFGNIRGLMPDLKNLPDDICYGRSWGCKLFNDWFYKGLTDLQLTPKDGIDKSKALRHIKAIMVSFEPKHEDKEAAVALLFDLWFKPGTWKSKPSEVRS